MSSSDVPAPQSPLTYEPDQIILYGVNLEGENAQTREAVIPFGRYFVAVQMREVNNRGEEVLVSRDGVAMAVVYGFAYEGACYRYDRPRLMIFEYKGPGLPASGCGFAEPYTMWRISEKKQILELNTRMDLAEMLVLDANLPGNRAPNTYGNKARLAHRSGRLTES